MPFDVLGTYGYGAWEAGPEGPPIPSFDSHDMLAPMSKLLLRRVHEEMERSARRQKEEADRLWKVMLVLHMEQTEARSLLKEAL